jgi:hypothetical protein
MGRCAAADLKLTIALDEQNHELDTFFAGKTRGVSCVPLRMSDYDDVRRISDRPGKMVKPSACKSSRSCSTD